MCRVPVICLVGWFECLRSEELQDIQLGLDWPLPGLCFFFSAFVVVDLRFIATMLNVALFLCLLSVTSHSRVK